ncbi:MAG: hypothetical protein A2017_18470 [Lentisphaerae bacterium GWF2_44_16]|nr:MAG: hypothetical protein A2017_18470 [Lentisphaerae bacterium GWF2_44_16]
MKVELFDLLFIALLVCGGFLLYFLMIFIHERKRRKLRAMPFPEKWKKIIEKNVILFNKLPHEFRDEIYGHINVFLNEKSFEGCGGLKITDEIKLTIASLASVLLLNRKTKYFSRLSAILVYPGAYVGGNYSPVGGVYIRNEAEVRLGESWMQGAVALAWDCVQADAKGGGRGGNVVLHEFAHQLDQESGPADGSPVFDRDIAATEWAAIFSREYKKLCLEASHGIHDVIDEYGTVNPAEFFAVATECFFVKSREMRKSHFELYEEMKKYYKLDPANW